MLSPPPINLPLLLLLRRHTHTQIINPSVMAQEVISHPALEPLALNYLTFGFQTLANNLWAWITLLTAAAITFWGSSHTTTTTSPPQEDLPPSPTTSPPPPPDDYQQFPIFADSIRSTRGKFTSYFHVIEQEEEEEDIDNVFEEEEEEEEREVVLGSSSIGKQTRPEEYSWEEAEMGLRMRMGMDLSWYSFQDLTVIDGNVVKMWEERR